MAPREFQVGETIGRFTLKKRLGVGSFGEVWRATSGTELGFSKEVALKLLRTDKDTTDSENDLLREARIVAQFRHPNIVDVFSAEYVDRMVLVAMEYMDGGTVEGLVDWCRDHERRLPRSAILHIGRDIALGLAYAWSATDDAGTPFRLVHRDLKPANVLLQRAGFAKVADFGLAKSSTEVTATKSGMVKGTPAYLAPELWQGSREFGPGVDLFSLGCILWELVLLRRLMGGDSMYAMFGQSIGGSPDEEAREVGAVFPDLAPLIRRLIERDPAQRLSDAAVVVDELQTLLKRERGGGDLADLLLAIGVVEGKEPDSASGRLQKIPKEDWQRLLRPAPKTSVYADTLAAVAPAAGPEEDLTATSKAGLETASATAPSGPSQASRVATPSTQTPAHGAASIAAAAPAAGAPHPPHTGVHRTPSSSGLTSAQAAATEPMSAPTTKSLGSGLASIKPTAAAGEGRGTGTGSSKGSASPPPTLADAAATVIDSGSARRSDGGRGAHSSQALKTPRSKAGHKKGHGGNPALLYGLLALGAGLLFVLFWLVASGPVREGLTPAAPVPAGSAPTTHAPGTPPTPPVSGEGSAPGPVSVSAPGGTNPVAGAPSAEPGAVAVAAAPQGSGAPTLPETPHLAACLIVRSSSGSAHVWVDNEHQDFTVGAVGRVLDPGRGTHKVGMGAAGAPTVEGSAAVLGQGATIVECSLIAGECRTSSGPATLCVL